MEYPKMYNPHKLGPDGKRTGEWTFPWFEGLRNADWTATEKLDGMNLRLGVGPDGPKLLGRTDAANIPNGLLEVFNRLNLDRLAPDQVLYGEGFGGKIQKGTQYGPDPRIVLFDAYSLEHQCWLDREALEGLAAAVGLPVVRVITTRTTLLHLIECVRSGITSDYGGTAEGLIARPTARILDGWGHRISVKIKARDYGQESK